MAGPTLAVSRSSVTLPHPGRDRRNSYLEKLNDISRELDFIRQSSQTNHFMPGGGGSPGTPLSATRTVSFVFEASSVPPVGPPAHYREPGSDATRGATLPASSQPFYNQLQSGAASAPVQTADYNALTAGIQSLTTSLKQESSRWSPSSPLTSPPPVPSPTPSTFSSTGQPMSPRSWNAKVAVMIPERKMELTHMTRLLHTKPIWYLPTRKRGAAAHYLQAHPVGTFVVRQGRQKPLVLTMKHPGTIPFIQHFPLQTTPSGKITWDQSDKEFDKIEDLIDYHMLVEDKLPCRLVLPEIIMKAKNIRELQSLAVFEDEFWKPKNLSGPLMTIGVADPSVTSTRLSPIPSGSTSSSSSSSQPSSPYHIPPLISGSQQGYYVPPVTDNQTNQTNYHSILSPKSPLLNQSEYVNMPVSPKPLSPDPMSSWSSKPSYQSYPPSGHQGQYHSWGIENQWQGQRMSVESSSNRESLMPLQRQPMRYSTQSERDSLVGDTDRRYPPPACAPPPPPSATAYKDNIQGRPHSAESMIGSTPLATRQSAAYYKPHEFTRTGHNQVFTTPPPVTSAPPIPTHSGRVLSMYPPYQMPYTSGNAYSEPLRATGEFRSYSAPQGRPASDSSTVIKESKEQQRLSDSGICLQPIIVSGPSVAKEDPLGLFDPLHAAQSRTSEDFLPESLPPMRERLPSLDLRRCQNSNANSNSKVSSPNSNGSGAKPVVLTENLITLYAEDVDPLDVLPLESEESRVSSEDELEEQETSGEMNPEGSTGSGSGSSDLTNSQEMPSGSSIENVSMESEEPVEELKKATRKLKKRDPKKKLMNMKRSIHKYVKKKTTQLERTRKESLRVVGISQTYKKKIDPANDIRSAIDRLAANPDSAFAGLLEEFIQNSRVKAETEKPDVMMRNIRQFMTGMKNFLFNRQVPEVDSVMDKYLDLSMDELDAIVEGALHLYILKPLKDDIYKCFINEVKRNGSLAIIDHNIQSAKSRSMEELGIKANYVPPHAEAMNEIKSLIKQMEESFSPIKKLDYLLQIVTSVYNTVVDRNSGREVVQSMGADDFLPMFIYVLVQCEAVNIEVEADYMWGLIETTKLSGEGGYYLTTLSSAICILKQFEQETQSETKGFLSVMVATETNEIIDRTIPVLPGMTAADICRIISHKMHIENAEDDYYLYLLADEEVPLAGSSCPMYVKSDIETTENKRVRFGYKHKKHQVQWPPPTE